MKPKTLTLSASEIIDRLGGSGVLAKVFNITQPSVSEWRKEGIPPARMMYIKLAYPEIFIDNRKKSRRRSDAARA